mgnify:CR=1 FL=1
MDKKLKSTQGICVHQLTYYFPDKEDNKIYEYTGDHSPFCDGIDPEYLEEIKEEKNLKKPHKKIGQKDIINGEKHNEIPNTNIIPVPTIL